MKSLQINVFETQRSLLNYRFKGGSGEFERVFFQEVNYTEEARKNCIVGVVIMTFTVSCNNEISDLKNAQSDALRPQ